MICCIATSHSQQSSSKCLLNEPYFASAAARKLAFSFPTAWPFNFVRRSCKVRSGQTVLLACSSSNPSPCRHLAISARPSSVALCRNHLLQSLRPVKRSARYQFVQATVRSGGAVLGGE